MPENDYFSKGESEILEDINAGTVPDSVLVSKEGWREICRIRGRNFDLVDDEAWSDLCRDRGEAKRYW